MTKNHLPEYKGFPLESVAKGIGIGLIGASYMLNMFGMDNTETYAIGGGSLLTAGVLADGVRYARAYFNEKLDILKNQDNSGELEKKLKE
ncbi:hypothetical protein J4407_03010 [Candidatus Pacearchaeota archaeon]|nr:hypothetical protein [Candidatus Pacearchaeota archaeon]